MQERNEYTDIGASETVLAFAGEPPMSDTLWRCVQMRAGQVLNKVLFNSEQEADKFCAKMLQHEPDAFWHVEPVAARLLWN